MNLDTVIWNRSTYSTLDWLGDVGGLFDAIMILMYPLMAPFTAFALESTLFTTFFRYKDKNVEGEHQIPYHSPDFEIVKNDLGSFK